MKYYLIAGEASGDLHASRLMQELKKQDAEAEFRFYGGDQMAAVEVSTMVKHYRELAYMGFIPVFLHLPTILLNMRRAKKDIKAWQPDVVILVDYPGFNLKIAKYVRKNAIAPVYYYIAPKIWAWKEYRIKSIKRDVDELFSILPFEVNFFEGKHHYPIHYVGNPTADEVREFLKSEKSREDSSHKTIAILCGSRRQEIKANLPAMLQVTDKYSNDCQIVIAGAPSIDADYYKPFMEGHKVSIVFNQTYKLLSQAHAALVTSGTATLETALFGVPQVVCYETKLHWFFKWLRKKLLKVKYVSLVNLIADREVVKELVVDTFSAENIEKELSVLLPDDSPQRRQMLEDYNDVWQRLGDKQAPKEAARIICRLLHDQK
ncbi:MAG: lipid-A-disaccharide synthase [Prevotella sp.]|nr:lipid-A-disaccharide synthase [Prevotella sp.]